VGHLLDILAEESPLLVVLLEIYTLAKDLLWIWQMELAVEALEAPILMLQAPAQPQNIEQQLYV